jgi:hypothetical protein
LLKSTLLQLDPTFSERDYGAGSFLEFLQKMAAANLVRLRRSNGTYLVDGVESESAVIEPGAAELPSGAEPVESQLPEPEEAAGLRREAFNLLKQALAAASAKSPHRPLYLRQVLQRLRSVEKGFDEKRYGFRRLLDLLHEAQREGLLHIQRDRKGALRVFPEPQASTAETAGAALEPAVEKLGRQPAELASAAPETAPPIEIAEPREAGPGEAAELEQPAPQEPPARRIRKPRARKGAAKGSHRKPASRRKTGETDDSQP